MRSKGSSRTVRRLVARAVAAFGVTLALLMPAYAQFWGNWGFPRQQPRYQQPYHNPFGGGFFGQPEYRPAPREREREAPADYSHAPAPPRKQADAAAPVTTPVVVMGDAMADWLAYGLEDALAEKPEFGVVRKHRTTSGLIRYEPRRETEWAQVAREIITAEKPKFIVMMIGVNDRQSIRERAAAAASARGAAKGKAAPAAAPGAAAPPSDLELQAQQSADQQNAEQQSGEPQDNPAQPAVEAPESTRASSGNYEFRSEKWEAAYIKRIDATIAAMKSANVPVLWVGLPAQRNSRATSDSAYLNELYRQRAEKAGIIYVDVWDGFVDDGGRYSNSGPDFEGQIRRLRSGDGVYFTKAGARKLAHYVEREIQRNITNRGVPIAMPAPEPTVPTPSTGPATGTRPSGPSRPVAGPVVPLTASLSSSDQLLGGGRAPQPATTDPVAVRVLTKGEPLSAPTGRADDFSWPRNNVVTAEPGAQQPATASAPADTAPAARTATTTPTTTPTASDRVRAHPKQPQANAAQRASNPDGADTDAAAPARRRPRPPAPTNIAPRDDVPRPPGLIGGR
jgi:hypothetical protein